MNQKFYLFLYSTCNVLIEIEVNGNSEYAPVKDDVVANVDSMTVWGDHLFFEMRGLVSGATLYISFRIFLNYDPN